MQNQSFEKRELRGRVVVINKFVYRNNIIYQNISKCQAENCNFCRISEIEVNS